MTRYCPCCGDDWQAGHTPMDLHYVCPDCGATWEDTWCAAVDSDCHVCGARKIEPETWTPWAED